MDKRKIRISCFLAGQSISTAPVIHRAPRTAEKSEEVYIKMARGIGEKYQRVIMHRGNLKHESYQIIKQTNDRMPPAPRAPKEPRIATSPELDLLTRKLTAFHCFRALVNAKGGYWPSLNVSRPECLELATAYDLAQIGRGDSRRAHRYTT